VFREAPSRRIGNEKYRGHAIDSDREFILRPSKSDDPVSYRVIGNERNEYLAVIPSFSLFSDLTVTNIVLYLRVTVCIVVTEIKRFLYECCTRVVVKECNAHRIGFSH